MKNNVVMSMVNPSTDELLTKVDSRYSLVVLAAKRARQILSGSVVKSKAQSTKNVTNALEEILEDKITYEIVTEPQEHSEEISIEELAGGDDGEQNAADETEAAEESSAQAESETDAAEEAVTEETAAEDVVAESAENVVAEEENAGEEVADAEKEQQ